MPSDSQNPEPLLFLFEERPVTRVQNVDDVDLSYSASANQVARCLLEFILATRRFLCDKQNAGFCIL